MQRVVLSLLILALSAVGSTVAMGGGGAGHGGGTTGSHGGMKPGGGGGTYNLPLDRRAHVPATPPDLLQKRIRFPRS